MPLLATDRPVALLKGEPWAVGFAMQVANSIPAAFVEVLVTYECVEDLDHPGQLADKANATAIAEANRALLESVASAKFDAKGLDLAEGQHEGRPVLRLHSYDLPG
jgi:hypothetical protein